MFGDDRNAEAQPLIRVDLNKKEKAIGGKSVEELKSINCPMCLEVLKSKCGNI